jgi:hypothetical protein
LHEVDVGEAAFAEQAQDFEGPVVYSEGWGAGEAGEAVCEGPEGVEDVGGEVGQGGGLGLLHCCGCVGAWVGVAGLGSLFMSLL